jgi:hypothetical protein
METIKKSIFLCGISCLIISCVSVSIESNKDPAYSEYIEKMYVIVETGDLTIFVYSDDPFSGTVDLPAAEYLQNIIEEKFREVGIDIKAVAISGLELDKGEIEEDIRDFGARTVMSLQLTEYVLDQYRQPRLLKFDATILDLTLYRNVWRAKISSPSLSFSALDAVIDEIISTMRNDELLTSFEPI